MTSEEISSGKKDSGSEILVFDVTGIEQADRYTRITKDVGAKAVIRQLLTDECFVNVMVDLVEQRLGKMIYLGGGSRDGDPGFGLGELVYWRREAAGAVRHRELADLSIQRDKRQKEMKTLIDYKRRVMDALIELDYQAHGRVVPVDIIIEGVNGVFISMMRRIKDESVLGMNMYPGSVEDALEILSVWDTTRYRERRGDETTNSWSGD